MPPTFPPRPGTVRPGLYRPEQPPLTSFTGSGGIVVAGPTVAGLGTIPVAVAPPIPPGGVFAPTPTARIRRRLYGRGGITVAGPTLAGLGIVTRPRVTATGRIRVPGPRLNGTGTMQDDREALWLLDVDPDALLLTPQ